METWFGKREVEKVGDDVILIPGWPRGHPRYGIAAQLLLELLLAVKVDSRI